MIKGKKFDIFTEIESNLKPNQNQKAIIYQNKDKYESLSYKEFEHYAEVLALHLKKQGIKPDDKVVVMIPVSLSLYIVIFSLIKLGVAVVFIDPWIGIKKIKEVCSICKPKGFIGNIKSSSLRLFSKEFRKIAFKMTISDTNALFLEKINSLKTDEKVDFRNEYKPDSPMFIRFTTGSSGEPKGVIRTYSYTCKMIDAITDFFPIKNTDVDITTFTLNIFYDLIMGATVVIPPMSYKKTKKFDSSKFIDYMRKCKITTASGSPYFWSGITKKCKEQNITLEKLRFAFTGGGPVSLNLIEQMKKTLPNAEIKIVYGSTECFPISWIDVDEISTELKNQTVKGKGLCLGKIHKDIKIKIIKPTDKKIKIKEKKDWENILLKKFEIGEIIVTGPHVIKKYWEEKSILFEKNKIKDMKKNIWHRTGDAGYLDDKNRIWLVGSRTNIFKIKNKNMSSLMFEYVFDALDEIEKTAILKDKKLVLFVQPKNKKILKDSFKKKKIEKEIYRICKKKDLPVEEIVFTNRIPLDKRHNTKVDYKKLESIYKSL